ncbi:MAG: cyclase family protein [Saprospiraceae bacterium]
MRIEFEHRDKRYEADLSKGRDLSIPISNGTENPNCFWAPMPVFSPVRAGDFVGSTAEGGPLNFYNVAFNPHGNGTHTECMGHISNEGQTIVNTLKQFHFPTLLVSLFPEKSENGDRIFYKKRFEEIEDLHLVETLIVRSLPNGSWKKTHSYSGTNPPYFEAAAIEYLVENGIKHLLIDLPSVDREEDGGALSAHRAFWMLPEAGDNPDPARRNCTITEMIYAADDIKDGLYLLNIQTASFRLDASPSKPVIFPMKLI